MQEATECGGMAHGRGYLLWSWSLGAWPVGAPSDAFMTEETLFGKEDMPLGACPSVDRGDGMAICGCKGVA